MTHTSSHECFSASCSNHICWGVTVGSHFDLCAELKNTFDVVNTNTVVPGTMTIPVSLLFLLLLQSLHLDIVLSSPDVTSTEKKEMEKDWMTVLTVLTTQGDSDGEPKAMAMSKSNSMPHSYLRAGVRTTARSLEWRGPLDNRYKSKTMSEESKKALNLYPPDYVFVDDEGVDAAATSQVNGTLAIVDTVAEETQVDQALDQVKDEGKGELSRRKFVSYEPSKWEAGWVYGIAQLAQAKTICQTLLEGKHQQEWLHKFMMMMCSARPDPPNDAWCYFHDHNHFVWYNSKNTNAFELYIDKTPLQLDGIEPPMPTLINTLEMESDWEEIASKFTFIDETNGEEYYEYIEPLVAQLRFPLAGCLERKPLLADFASFVIPPPSLSRVDGRTIMYDMGSSDWSRMEYIVEEWGARDAGFTYLITYAPSENENADAFLESVPEQHKSHIYRHYLNLVDQPTTEHSDPKDFFLPTKIHQQARSDDYIMVKFDRSMNANLKESLVQSILDYPTSQVHVDEVFWEINASGNYVMQDWFDSNLQFDEISSMALSDAYEMLTALRNRGIRAHAWI